MSVRCGNCSTFQNPVDHDTVADVRTCYSQRQGITSSPPPASPPSQVVGTVADLDDDEPGQTVQKPRTPGKVAVAFPAGRYACDIGDGKLRFFKVDKPTEGRWAGYVFVKEQASDELYPVKGSRRDVVLDVIGKDPETAMLTYGRELGSCGHCGRTLTDEDSRARGIGPICAGKVAF